METSISVDDIAQAKPVASSPAVNPEDTLGFFTALWLWLPVALGLWTLIIWTVLRLV